MTICSSLKTLRRELPAMLAVFLYFVSDNMTVITALPLITYGVCRDVFPNTSVDFCLHINEHPAQQHEIQKTSALLLMAEKMFSIIPPMILATILGPWSDQHGRRLPFLLPFVGNVASACLFLLSVVLHDSPVIVFIMAGFLVRSFFGQFILVHLISFSYVADVVYDSATYQEVGAGVSSRRGKRGRRRQNGIEDSGSYEELGQRSLPVEVAGDGDPLDQSQFLAAMTRLQVAESLGTVTGSLLGWVFQKAGGPLAGFLVAASIMTLGILVVVFFLTDLPRTSAHYDNRNEDVGQSGLRRFLRKALRTFRCRSLDVDPLVMWSCLVITFAMFACREGRSSVTAIYVQSPPLSWANRRLAGYSAAYGGFQSIFLFLVAPALQDRTVVVVGLVCSAVGGVWMGFSATTWGMILAGCLSHMMDCIFPALRAILAHSVSSQDHVGELLTRMSVAEALATIAGPVTVAELYTHSLDYYPGLAFVATAAVPGLILLLGAAVEACCYYSGSEEEPGYLYHNSHSQRTAARRFQPTPVLAARNAARRPNFTQSLNVPSATVSGYGLFWCSTEW